MKSPGTLLKEAREKRGLTIDDVAAMTRVPKPMLRHLEEDRFEEYEAEVFARGHLRNYAREMHLDVAKVIEAYERHTGHRKVDPIQEARQAGRIKSATPATASGAVSTESSGSGGNQVFSGVSELFGGVQRTHLVAVVLVLVGLVMMLGYLSGNQVSAQDAAEYEEAEESDWGGELQDDIEETRWLLEQSDDAD